MLSVVCKLKYRLVHDVLLAFNRFRILQGFYLGLFLLLYNTLRVNICSGIQL